MRRIAVGLAPVQNLSVKVFLVIKQVYPAQKFKAGELTGSRYGGYESCRFELCVSESKIPQPALDLVCCVHRLNLQPIAVALTWPIWMVGAQLH